MMDDAWKPDLDAIAAEIAHEATQPPDVPNCFIEWLDEFWNDSSEEEATDLWTARARSSPWVCAGFLRCLNAVLRDPPPDVVELMQERGWINLFHRNVTPWRPYDREEYLHWLADARDRFSTILDGVS